MPRELKDINLVIIDSVEHALSALALKRTLQQINPALVIIASNRPESIILAGMPDDIIRIHTERLTSLEAVAAFMWYGELQDIGRATHTLFIQYDGWVLNGEGWDDRWLGYDYIGAPWPWHDHGQNVGNGGFSLRSTRLMYFLAKNRAQFPVITPEDDTLCRKYRQTLEEQNFHWASFDAANQFAFERSLPRLTFGFHGIFNVPKVLSPSNYDTWKLLASPYARQKPEWGELP